MPRSHFGPGRSVVPSRGVGSTTRHPCTIGGGVDAGSEVVKAFPEERASERIVEQIAWTVPVDCIKDRITERSVDVPGAPPSIATTSIFSRTCSPINLVIHKISLKSRKTRALPETVNLTNTVQLARITL